MDSIEKIEQWRKAMGLPVRKSVTLCNQEEQKLACDLIEEELNELKEAIKNNDIVEIADACGDLMFVVVQAANIHGLDVNRLIETIFKSNMSKPCKDIKESRQTVDAYKKKGIETVINVNNKSFLVKRKSDNKVLKSINWKSPDWKGDYPELFEVKERDNNTIND